jgi:hypothetical protein
VVQRVGPQFIPQYQKKKKDPQKLAEVVRMFVGSIMLRWSMQILEPDFLGFNSGSVMG